MRAAQRTITLGMLVSGLLIAASAAQTLPARAASGVVPMGTALPRATPTAKRVTVADAEITLSASQRLIFVELYADW